MPNYEYTTVLIDTSSPDNIRRTLNDMGRNGWEMVTVTADRQYIFKRRVETKVIGPSETKKGTGPLSEALLKAKERRSK